MASEDDDPAGERIVARHQERTEGALSNGEDPTRLAIHVQILSQIHDAGGGPQYKGESLGGGLPTLALLFPSRP